ncbi:S-type anion channel SLAH1, partial [Cucurbita argyrosperma subsp. argyrosperma]
MESPAEMEAQNNDGGRRPPVISPALEAMLRKFHAGYFRIGMSISGQALIWAMLAEENHGPIHRTVLLVLWSLAFFILFLLSLLYLLRCVFHFPLVQCEFFHHVGVNYLFAPWISWFLLLQSMPFLDTPNFVYMILWCAFAIPVVILDVKIYGQWFTEGRRFLCIVANPTSQLSVIGNLVGAQAAAKMGWKESALCFFSLGIVHYLVLFVTLYQRFSGANRLPSMLRPVFFLHIAAPSVASVAWESINGGFDMTSKMLFFLSLFIFMALACRPFLFRRAMKRFNIAWWAFSFPLSALALASVEYHRHIQTLPSKLLMLLLLALSVLVALLLFLITLLNSDVLLLDDDTLYNLPSNHFDSSLKRIPTSNSIN